MFWLWGKDNLFSFPKNQRYVNIGCSFFFQGQQRSFSSVFVDERFINKAQFDAGFAHSFILKDGAVSAIKDRHSSARHSSLFSSAHGTPPGARLFSERIVKLYLSFINMIKLKIFGDMKDAILLYRYSRLTWESVMSPLTLYSFNNLN